MSNHSDCVFCKIENVEIPASVVYEDDTTLAFLDVGPLAEGHLLVIPRTHYERFIDMPSELCAKVVSVLPTLGRALLEVTGALGYNVLLNDGSIAGQVVLHAHFHLIPRFKDDGLGYRWIVKEYPEGKAAEIASAYQQAITHQNV